MYAVFGLEPIGRTVKSGSVAFEVMSADVAASTAISMSAPYAPIVEEWRTSLDWRLDTTIAPRPDGCEHGGASFTAIGTGFDRLERRHQIVAADVLDAWFPPAPGVVEALTTDPAWMARTSPPTDADGLMAAIGAARGLPVDASRSAPARRT